MKKHLYVLAILALVLLNACGPVYVVQQPTPPPSAPAPMPPPPPEQQPEASTQSFYDDLSPYGQWIDDPNYGYVWLPDVGPDFKPYATNGHWVYTEEGWTWASDYPWGWAAFHYGRWFFQDGYGWMWVPGNEYSPAWVTWRNSDDYYGWAPMGPGISFDMAYGGGYAPPPHYWNFVPHQYVSSPQIRNYYVNESRNVVIINHTTINNITIVNNNNVHVRNVNYGRGPDPNEVGRYTGNSIRPMPIRQSARPVTGGQVDNGGLAVYRPRINDAPRNNNNGNMGAPPRMAPTRVSNWNNARPQNQAVYGGNRPANTGFPTRDNNPVNNRPPNGYQQPQQPVTQPQQQQPVTQPQQPVTQPQQPRQQPGNPPANQPFNPRQDNNRPDNNKPVDNRPSVMPPANQPEVRPFQRPVQQQPVTQPQQPQNQPVQQQPQQPVTQPQQPGRPMTRTFTPPPARPGTTQQPVSQPANNRPVFTPRQLTPQQPAPAVQQRPVSRPVTPPPAPKKDDDKKDTRPVRQQ